MLNLMAIACALRSVVHVAALPGGGGAPRARGLFALDDILDGKMPALPEFTQGVTIRVAWSDVQPNATTFNWTRLDQSVLRAQASGRQLQFGVHPGASTPPWVYSAGAAAFPMLWNKPFSHGNCTTVPIPVPWDPIYLARWTSFVRALAERYDPVAAVTGVKFAGLNAQSMENDIPAKNVSNCGGSGVVWDPSAIWQRLGYTPDRITDTFTTLVSCYNTAFRNTSVVLMTGNFPWPAIDNSGQLTPRLDYQLSAALTVQFGRTAVNGEVANNGLSATRAWSPPANLTAGVPTGAQALWAITGDEGCRMNGGNAPCDAYRVMNATLENAVLLNVTYLEVYLVDLINPLFAPLLEKFARHITWGTSSATAGSAVTSIAVEGGPCTDSDDCSLNGDCTDGACVCNTPWAGADCAHLLILPSSTPAGGAIYGVSPRTGSSRCPVRTRGKISRFR